jgi:hypothetical protein
VSAAILTPTARRHWAVTRWAALALLRWAHADNERHLRALVNGCVAPEPELALWRGRSEAIRVRIALWERA